MTDNFESERILITGGTGFLGKHVLRKLIIHGAKPIVLSRRFKEDFLEEFGETIFSVEFDIDDDQKLKELFNKYQPKNVIHLAGSSGKNNERTSNLDTINYKATVKLLKFCEHGSVKRIIITGTADEYGFQMPPQSEETAAKPVSDYALTKNKAVEHALFLFERSGLPVVVLRPFTIYGIGQPSEMFVPQAVECALKTVPFEMSNGTQKRDLVFVTDFADAMIKALATEKIEGEIFNVGSGIAIPLRDLAIKIWKIAGADPKLLKIGARPTADQELHDTQADVSKIKSVLGWESETSIDEGLKIIIENSKIKFNER